MTDQQTGPTDADGSTRRRNRRPALRLTGTGRIEAFSDGVFAIAITLLVLDLHTSETIGRVGHDLLHQWPSYLAYVASFLYIGVVWINHHALFARIAKVDTGLLWSNLALLLASSVLPFPTAELAFAMREGTDRDKVAALVLYSLVSAGMGAGWLLTFNWLHRHPELVADDVPTRFFHRERLRALGGLAVPAVTIVVGLASPPAAIGVIVLTPVFYALTAEGLPTPDED